MSNRRAIVFSLDAVLTLLVLLILVPLSGFLRLETTPTSTFQTTLYYQAQDAIDALSTVRLADVRDNPTVQELFRNGQLQQSQLNSSVLDAIGTLWAANTTQSRAAASNLTNATLHGLLPPNFGWALTAEVTGAEDVIFNSTNQPSDARVVFKSTRYASGFAANQPPRGFVANAILDAIKGKLVGAYAFFGGFVGQGNVSAVIHDVPLDANVRHFYIEGDFGSNASVYLNGIFCGMMNRSSDPVYSATNATFTNCIATVVKGGDNIVSLNFTSQSTENYIGGGYAKIVFDTQNLGTSAATNRTLYHFPGIKGLVNLYDGLYVPGNATNVTIYVHVNTSYAFFLNIGNITVINSSGAETDLRITVTNQTLAQNFSTAFGIGNTISPLDRKNIPIRLGLSNIPLNLTADIAFSFDVSGSMDDCVYGSSKVIQRDPANYFEYNGNRYCYSRDEDTCRYPDETKLQAAKRAGDSFVDTIITGSRNRMGILDFSDTTTVSSTGSAASYDFYPLGIYPWLSPNHPYRMQIAIHNNNLTRNITSGTPINVTINHTDLVVKGKSLANGTDLRIAWFNQSAGTYTDLNRFNTTRFNTSNTQIWFPAQETILPGSNSTDYFLYYGNASLGAPSANPQKLFLLYDDFTDGDFKNSTNWTVKVNSTAWGAAGGNLTVNGSNFKASAFAGNPGWSDYVLEAEVLFDTATNSQNASVFYYFNSTYTGGYETQLKGGSNDALRTYWWRGLNGSQSNNGKFIQLSTDNIGNVINGQWYTIKAGVYENYLRTYLNDVTYSTTYNRSYTNGMIGVGTSGNTGTNNAKAYFRRVYVRKWIYPDPTVYALPEETLGNKSNLKISVLVQNNNSFDPMDKGINNSIFHSNGTLVGYASAAPVWSGTHGTASLAWNASYGTYVVNASTDFPPSPTGDFSETNEANNNYSAKIAILPDLKIQWLKATPVKPTSGAATNFVMEAVIVNQGPFDSGTVTVSIAQTSGDSLGVWNSTTVTLAAGESRLINLTATKTLVTVGQQNLTATIDLLNAVTESREDNNQANASVYVNGVGYVDVGPDLPSQSTARMVAPYPVAPSCSGSNVALFTNGINRFKNLTNDAQHLKDYLAELRSWGGTCICCGITEAMNMLTVGGLAGRTKAIVLMTDGAPNVDCPNMINHNSSGNANTRYFEDSIASACNAYRLYGIKVYTVGFGSGANNTLLKRMAQCAGGANFSGQNAEELNNAFNNIAQEILNQTQIKQSINVSGDHLPTELFDDSYIDINYSINLTPAGFKEITIPIETERFGSCTGEFFVPPRITVYSTKVTSYSSSLWTSNATVNTSKTGWTTIHRLGDFANVFEDIGDPFTIGYNPQLVESNESNFVNIKMSQNTTSSEPFCSNSSRVIYDARIKAAVNYGSVFPNATGFNLTVYYDLDHDGKFDGFTYVAVGLGQAYFNATPITPSQMDTANNALADAVARMLDELNFFNPDGSSEAAGEDDNPIDLQLSDSVSIQTNEIAGVPYMWGPNAFSIKVWSGR